MVAYSSKSEVRVLFHNGKTVVPFCITLHELSFLQPQTQLKSDNSADEGIVTAKVRQQEVQGNGYAISLDKGRF